MTEVARNQQGVIPKKSRLKPVLIVVGIVVAAALAGAGVRWIQMQATHKRLATPTAVQQKVADTQNIALKGNYDEAQKQLKKALDNPKLSTDEKQQLINQQAVTYENQGKFKDAVTYYKNALDLKPNQNIAESIGRVAEKQGDKQTAITYYKKAISLIDKTNPVGDDDKLRYENTIRALGGSV